MFELYLKTPTQNGLIIREGIEKHNVWIEREDGEGGDFNKEKLLECLNAFYKEYF